MPFLVPCLFINKGGSYDTLACPCSDTPDGLLVWSGSASAFCGFYVGKADTKLFNKASEVAIARHDDKTVITMANDFKGDVKEFALVVPVPTVLGERTNSCRRCGGAETPGRLLCAATWSNTSTRIPACAMS